MCVRERERERKRGRGRNRVLLVVQQIIHVLSGQLHLANAAPLSPLAAADHLGASVKWTVNIDRETARGEQRPCQREKRKEREDGRGGG